MAWLGADLAIDPGCSTTRVHVRGQGIVVDEPSRVAVLRAGRDAGRVIAAGLDAERLLGRTPEEIAVVSPVRGGAVADVDALEAWLRLRLPGPGPLAWLRSRRISVSVPLDLTSVERRAVEEVALRAGARRVSLVPAPLAAALGLGLSLDRPTAHALLDLGGGTTAFAVLAFGRVVVSRSIRVGGAALNEALRDYVRRKFELSIGEPTVEEIKRRLGAATPTDSGETLEVAGRDRVGGCPRAIRLAAEEVREALEEPVARIVATVREGLDRTPPELAADLRDRGIVLVGGGALLRGLDRRLREATGLAVFAADEARTCVVRGAARWRGDAPWDRLPDGVE